MKPKARYIFTACVLLAASALAQTQKPLTNDDIIQMVQAGFAESVITKAIEANDPAFDTSVQGLLALKNAGISQTLIEAMLSAEVRKNAPSHALPADQTVSMVVPGLPAATGAYHQTVDGFVSLQEAPTPGHKAKGFFRGLVPGVAYVSGPSSVSVYRGARAPLQITEPRPVFYLRGADKSGRDVLIVRLDEKKDSREVQTMASKGLRGGEVGYKDDKIAELTVETVSADVVRVTSAEDLKEGEYLLIADEEHAYDFGVAKPR